MRQMSLLLVLACLSGCAAAAPGGQGLAGWISGRDRRVRQDVAVILHGMQMQRDNARALATSREP
jgi:hypothetical protein